MSTKIASLAWILVLLVLMACGGKATEEVIPVDQRPHIVQPPELPRCLARKYHPTDIGSANQVAMSATKKGWYVATSNASLNRYEPVQLHRFDGWLLSGEETRSAVNAGLGQFALSGDGTALLLSGYGHTEGERLKQMVEVVSLDSGKRLSLESWQPGAVSTDPVAGRGYVYAGTHIRESGMWAQLGSIEPDGIQTANSDVPLTGAQCAFFGGVVANLSGDIAAVVVMGDFVSRQYNILFLIYSRQFGRWSRAIIRSYPAPELSNGQCRPEAVIRPLGVFTGGTADGWVTWHAIWADSGGVHLVDIDSQTVRRREIQINLPAGTTALSAAQVPNGYLLALSGAPTERLDSTIGAAFVRPSGELAAYQPLIYGEMLAQPTVQPFQASTTALAASADGRTAALAYVAKGGQAKVRFFSNDCR